MKRRAVLTSALAASVGLAGCTASGSDDETSPDDSPADTPIDAPEWLQESAECDRTTAEFIGDGKTVLTLDGGQAEPLSDSQTVAYASLSAEVQTVVDFTLEHGSVESCEVPPPEPLDALVDAVDGAMDDGGGRPSHVYVEKGGTYYEVGLRVGDQIFYEPS